MNSMLLWSSWGRPSICIREMIANLFRLIRHTIVEKSLHASKIVFYSAALRRGGCPLRPCCSTNTLPLQKSMERTPDLADVSRSTLNRRLSQISVDSRIHPRPCSPSSMSIPWAACTALLQIWCFCRQKNKRNTSPVSVKMFSKAGRT